MGMEKDKKFKDISKSPMEMDKNCMENPIDKNADFEYDLLHIKDHLNASFDKDQIFVSEELIQKTLQAIQAGKEPLTSDRHVEDDMEDLIEESKNVKRYSIYKLARIAAVLLLLLVGLNLVQYLQLGVSKKGEAVKEEKISAEESDRVMMAESSAETTVESQDGKAEMNYSITADTTGEEAPNESASLKSEEKMSIMSGDILLSDILPFTSEEVMTMTVMDNNNAVVTSKDLDDIDTIFQLLNQFPLLLIENEEDALENQWNYQIQFMTQENVAYTILIGNEIQVKTDDNNSDIIRYSSIGDVDQLDNQLQQFLKQDNK